MKLEIRGRDVQITETLRAYIERRLRFALDRFAVRIGKVRLRVADVNGSRGGVDKHCRLEIWLGRTSPINLESRASSIRAAIDSIARKVGRVIARRVNRRHEFRLSRNPAGPLFGMPSLSLALHQSRGVSPS